MNRHTSDNAVEHFHASVIHLSSGYGGGAGIAARRLNAQLNAAGFPSCFVTLSRKEISLNLHEHMIDRTKWQRVKSFLLTLIQTNLSNFSFFSIFSTNVVTENLLKQFGSPNRTIVHVHNYYNLVSTRKLQKLAKKGWKIVVTLHDQRWLTGGCHASYHCKNFERNCAKCPLLPKTTSWLPGCVMFFHKRRIRKFVEVVQFVSPSRYMNQMSELSSTLKRGKVVVIQNVISDRFYNIESFQRAKKHKLGSKLTLGIASAPPDTFLKGSDAVSFMQDSVRQNNLDVEFLHMNALKPDADLIVDFWKKIDALLVLSRADNSPNVIHEAKILGIPVIAMEVGGITELLQDSFDIKLKGLPLSTSKVLALLERIPIRSSGVRHIEIATNESFESELSTRKHISLYHSIMDVSGL